MAISAQFTADFSQFTAAASEAQQALTGVTTAAADFDVERQAHIAGAAIRELAGEVQAFATDYISAFAEEEAATARLSAALEASGASSSTVVAQYAAMASQFQQTTRYSDDAITGIQTLFTQIGVGAEDMEAAVTAATNLASGLKIGLPEAAKLMATAISSGGESLGKLNKYLDDTETKGKSTAEIMELLNSKFGGQAAADMTTTEGKLANLNNKFDDMKGKVGEVLANALMPLIDAFSQLPDGVQTLIVGVVGLGTALAPIAIAFGAVVSAVGPLLALIGGAGGLTAMFAGLLPFLGPAGLIVAGVTAVYLAFKNWDKIVEIAKAVYQGVKTWLVDNLGTILGYLINPISAVTDAFKWMYDKVVGHSFVPDMVDGIEQQFKKLDAVMVDPARIATNQVLSSFNKMSHNLMMIKTDSTGVAFDLFGRPVVPDQSISALPKTMGQQNWTININGSVLSTKDQIAMVMEDAMMHAYSSGGRRLPV